MWERCVQVARNDVDDPGNEIATGVQDKGADKHGMFSAIARFFREVMGELRKVVTPTRKELFNYTGVVLVFVMIMIGIVWTLDMAFSWFVLNLFGQG